MAAISRIKPDQVLYSVERRKMGNTTLSETVVFAVRVKEVDPEGRFVIASHNGNPVRRYSERAVAKWKVNKPETKKKLFR